MTSNQSMASKSSSSLHAHVAVLWADNANLVRCRVVPRKRLEREADDFHVNLTHAIQSMPAMYDLAFEAPVGQVQLYPEPDTFYDISSWMESTSACFGDMKTMGKKPWAHCPRSFLRRHEALLKDKFGVTGSIGFELEFQLLRDTTKEPVDNTVYCETKAFRTGQSWAVVKRIVECLQNDLGIPVLQYHPESASGQFEISIGTFTVATTTGASPLSSEDDTIQVTSLVGAVDRLVLARQCIAGIAAQYDLQATFVPKLSTHEAGNAAHLHLGLREAGDAAENVFASRPKIAEGFLAGLLQELPSMAMVLAPSFNSYARLQPKCWAGAYHCYGYENREAPIRLISDLTDSKLSSADHFELKTLDATANPYLAVGAVLAAGILGIEKGLTLPAPVNVDPATLPQQDQPKLLPRSLSEAIETFKTGGSVWKNIYSESYWELLLKLRQAENAYYGGLEPQNALAQLVQRF